MLVVFEDCRWGKDWTWQEGLGAAADLQQGLQVALLWPLLLGGSEKQLGPWGAAISLAAASLDSCMFHIFGLCRAAWSAEWRLHESPLGRR